MDSDSDLLGVSVWSDSHTSQISHESEGAECCKFSVLPPVFAGVDSRAAMELRQTLSTTLGVPLPVTLLYDHQSVAEIIDYIQEQLATAEQMQPGASDSDREGEESDDDGSTEAKLRGGRSAVAAANAAAAAAAAASRPSVLLKTLRASPSPRPLFLAAPGVANAQSAYFSFSQFLAWSDQPIYVLDKDNDLDITK